jgi:hypothetical protein
MKNQDELLKRILLNMKYNSRETLSENKEKILLKEETCDEIRSQIYANLDQTTYGVKGQPRSKNYNWGTWGDGSCICATYNPPQGFKYMCSLERGFSPKCCKDGKKSTKDKPSVSVGDITRSNEKENAIQTSQEFYDETAYDGTPLKLPTSVQNIKKTRCGELRIYYSNEPLKFENVPKIKNLCTFLRDKKILSSLDFKTYEDCLSSYGNKLLSFCNDDAVESFEFGGLTYTPCFTGIGTAPTFKSADNMIFKGYFGADDMTKKNKTEKGECIGVKWNSSSGTAEKPENTKVDQFGDEKKGSGAEGGYGDGTISFIL